jgi:hypothetical protein
LYKLLYESTAERAMTVVDAVLIADTIDDAMVESGETKLRANLNKVYDRIRREDSSNDGGYGSNQGQTNMQPPEYIELGEQGIPGLAPVG